MFFGQAVRAQQNAPLDLHAKALPTAFPVQLVDFLRRGTMAVANAVVPGQIAASFCAGKHQIGGQSQRQRREGDRLDLRAQSPKCFCSGANRPFHVRVQSLTEGLLRQGDHDVFQGAFQFGGKISRQRRV